MITKPSRLTSAPVRRLTPSSAAAEPPRRSVRLAFVLRQTCVKFVLRRTFVSNRALHRQVLLRTVCQSIASKRTLIDKMFLPVCTSVAAAEALGSAYTSKYTSQVYIPMYTCIYTSQQLYRKRAISGRPELDTYPIVERLRLIYTTGFPGLAPARHHHEVRSKELDRHS